MVVVDVRWHHSFEAAVEAPQSGFRKDRRTRQPAEYTIVVVKGIE
jgi:hypothetical protein